MAKFDAKAAAERIRPLLADNPWPDDRDALHQQTCLDAVCRELEVEATVLNMSHVAVLLVESDTGLHNAHMYPKAHNVADARTGRLVPAHYPPGHEHAGLPVIFLNQDEETEYSKLVMSQERDNAAS
jgi:hypothetical protein